MLQSCEQHALGLSSNMRSVRDCSTTRKSDCSPSNRTMQAIPSCLSLIWAHKKFVQVDCSKRESGKERSTAGWLGIDWEREAVVNCTVNSNVCSNRNCWDTLMKSIIFFQANISFISRSTPWQHVIQHVMGASVVVSWTTSLSRKEVLCDGAQTHKGEVDSSQGWWKRTTMLLLLLSISTG